MNAASPPGATAFSMLTLDVMKKRERGRPDATIAAPIAGCDP